MPAPELVCLTEVDDDKIKVMIENIRDSTTREISEKLNISHKVMEPILDQHPCRLRKKTFQSV